LVTKFDLVLYRTFDPFTQLLLGRDRLDGALTAELWLVSEAHGSFALSLD
jgi:hypothetical protein